MTRTQLRSILLFAGLSLALTAAGRAQATDLLPDSGDPNGAPPMPPPMPAPGTPGSTTPPPPPGSTASTLDIATQEDTGVGLHFLYIQPEIGIGWATLGDTIARSESKSGVGPAFGVGVGGEFITFQLGGRLRAIATPQFNLWTLGGEVAYQPGSGRFWPRIGLAVGYAWANNWQTDLCTSVCGNLDVSGIDIGLRAGLQYYVSSNIEIGADIGLDMLMLKRKAINGSVDFAQDANGNGMMAVALAHIGWHYP